MGQRISNEAEKVAETEARNGRVVMLHQVSHVLQQADSSALYANKDSDSFARFF